MPSRIDLLTETQREGLLASDDAVRRELVRRWLGVERAIKEDLVDLADRVSRLRGGTPTVNDLREEQRFRRLLRQAQIEIYGYADDAEVIIGQHQQSSLQRGITDARRQIEMLYDGSFTYLPIDAVSNVVGLLGNGSPLVDTLRDIDSRFADQLGQRLIDGVARGKHPEVIANEMNKVINTNLYRSLVIARTESLRAYNTATQQQYKESGVVNAWQRRETKDRRCCSACLVMDGTIYPLDVTWHDHVNGRGTLVPVIDDREARQRPTAWQWFESLPESDQRDILGDSRYEAWTSGVNPSRFARLVHNPDWGYSLQVTPVKEL